MVLPLLLIFAASASSQQDGTVARCPADKIAPAEVATLLKRARICDHLSGEIGAGGERGKDVSQMSALNQCDFVDGELARMKKKFAANCRVMADIGDYEAGRSR